jgi:hypothetical protein
VSFNHLTLPRLVLVIVTVGWIFGGPAYRQLFDGKVKWVPRWVMFAGLGHKICSTRFVQIHEDGTEEALDRWDVLGRDKWSKRSNGTRRIMGSAEVYDTGSALCRKLGEGADVRAIAKCGSRKGWHEKFRGRRNLCESKYQRRGKKQRKQPRSERKRGSK